jgi:hypothetical protein
MMKVRMTVKAIEITDPEEMLARIAYRNERLHTRVALHDDPISFAKHLASRNKSDLRRLAELLGFERL